MQPTPTTNTETDRELKAYIYQQLVDLQPYLIPDSQMAVTVQQVVPVTTVTETTEDEDFESEEDSLFVEEPLPLDGEYVVKLTATMDGGSLEAEGHGEDVYQAFGEAKGFMVQQLNAIHNALVDSAEREEEIQSWLNGERTLH